MRLGPRDGYPNGAAREPTHARTSRILGQSGGVAVRGVFVFRIHPLPYIPLVVPATAHVHTGGTGLLVTKPSELSAQVVHVCDGASVHAAG